ncbi:MAG: hypothetical protein C0480_17535 [Bradyrhizobium sp.]|nr:hypothetical protein [Bradyrhizobium sp.]
MTWMRERDLLIAQTMAFVQSVTGKKPDAETMAATPVMVAPPVTSRPAAPPSTTHAPAPIHDIAALLAVSGGVAERPKPTPPERPDLRDEFQSEIKARVANFRAHQERFNREREAYCSATMARVHASIKEAELPPRLDK